MARPLRIELAGGLNHLTARGNERRPIYKDARDREHFLELLAELPARFGSVLHAYVLMDNHYHLVIETPEPNLSRIGQWINVSYGVWYNHRHGRTGHLFRGRFKSHVIEEDGGLMEVSRYVHLNPVRVGKFGLSKGEQRRQRSASAMSRDAHWIKSRIQWLRNYRWSSYPVYQGIRSAPDWLRTEGLLGRCGKATRAKQHAAMKEYVEQPIREGFLESPWERLIGGVVLGSKEFAESLRRGVRTNRTGQSGIKAFEQRVSWKQIVKAVEKVKGEKWESFRDRYGDSGRDAALYLGRHQGRMKLTELAEVAGGIDYLVAGAAVSRFGKRVKQGELEPLFKALTKQLSRNRM
jgi:putative transposase